LTSSFEKNEALCLVFWAKIYLMKKYWLVFTQNISQISTYRFQILLTLLQNLTQPAILLAVLFFVKPGSSISFSSLVPYYLLVALISPLTISNIDEELDELTASGDINNFLLKPFSLTKWLYAKAISEKITLLLLLCLPVGIAFALANFDFLQILSLLFILVLSFSLSFFLSFLVGISCFWIEDFWAIHNVKFVTTSLLGGLVLPYQFFPSVMQNLLRYSPFPYLVNFPIKYIQHQTSFEALIIAVVWLGILILASTYFLRLAITKYSYVAS
jgi:ABC-2 type transport system permease protein